jgi:hypothetical protein
MKDTVLLPGGHCFQASGLPVGRQDFAESIFYNKNVGAAKTPEAQAI